MYLSLGTFVFSHLAVPYHSLSRNTSWRVAEHKRISEPPVLQFVGPDSDKLTIDGILYPQVNDAAFDVTNVRRIGNAVLAKALSLQEVSLDPLRQMAQAGESYALVDQWGYVYGRWAIQSINEKQTHIMQGRSQRIEFSIALVRDEDPGLKTGGGLWQQAARIRKAAGALGATAIGKTASGALKDALASVGKIL